MSVCAITSPADDEGGGVRASKTPQLSTDYLNRYSEALMLIEMAADDDDVVEDLQAWRGVTYREHFETSPLRCAAAALAAYDGIVPARRAGFEELCKAMTRLVSTATALLVDKPEGLETATITEVAGEALRRQISRATQFINAGGKLDIGHVESRSLQAEIDLLLAR